MVLEKLSQGQYSLTHTVLSKLSIFYQMFVLGLMYILFDKIYNKFKSRYNMTWNILSFESIFFSTLKYHSLANANHGQYGLTRIVCLGKFDQYLSKTDMVRFVLYLTKYSLNSYQDKIPFKPSCALKDSQ